MVNPGNIMKLMSAKNQFEARHPKFSAFFQAIMTQGVDVGSVIEVSIQRPGEEPVMANMRVTQEDIDLVNELKTMGT